MHVEHFMTKNPVACDAKDAVRDVATLMRDKNVGFVVVLRDGKVAGVVTDRQLTTRVLAPGLAPDAPVEKVMTPNPARVTLADNLFTVVDTLRSAGVVRRVPVVNDNDELVGVVSISDIAVIAQDLVDAVLLEDTRHALKEARVLTGGKSIQKELRNPRPQAHGHREPAAEPVTRSAVAASGARARPPSRKVRAAKAARAR